MLQQLRNKKGSSTVMLAMAFVSLALCVAGAIGISRQLTVKSICESFGRVWCKAILGEYDNHLLEDYHLQAYWGLDSDVHRTIDSYLAYTLRGKLASGVQSVSVNLCGTELSDPDNFRQALRNSGISELASGAVNGDRRVRIAEPAEGDRWGRRIIRNRAVIETLPSHGISNSFDAEAVKNNVKSIGSIDEIIKGGSNLALEYCFIQNYLGSHNERVGDRKTLLRNEWEYLACGKLDDDQNYKLARRRIFLIRNALNLLYLSKDPVKTDLIIAAAEMITPGPAAAATQVLIAEAWAALEAKEDMELLKEGGRVPVMKTEATWQTDLKSVLKSSNVKDHIDEDARRKLEEGMGELTGKKGAKGRRGSPAEGLTYEDYLMLLIASVNDNVRTLRIMDIVSINMRYRYYEDFSMDEYHTAVRFSVKANGREYAFEERYR